MKNKKIFLAEDETIIALDLKSLLKRNGFNNIQVFSDGEMLLRKALEDPPDLVITDIILKNKTNGIKSAEKIWEKYDIPVMFISAAEMDQYKKKFRRMKCDFLKKPFKEGDFINSLFSLLQTCPTNNFL